MHNFLVCALKSQDFAQSRKKIARSPDRTTARFRNSGFHTANKTLLYTFVNLCNLFLQRELKIDHILTSTLCSAFTYTHPLVTAMDQKIKIE